LVYLLNLKILLSGGDFMKVYSVFGVYLLVQTLLFILEKSSPNPLNPYLMVVTTIVFYYFVYKNFKKLGQRKEV
jgi:hypothetical protein